MAGSKDKPGLPQRRGRKDPGELPEGFEPITPLFRRSKTPATQRPLPRAAAPRLPDAPRPRPAPELSPVIAEPPPQHKTRPRVLAAAIATALLVLILVAIVLWATG